jgi:hypothetical protein
MNIHNDFKARAESITSGRNQLADLSAVQQTFDSIRGWRNRQSRWNMLGGLASGMIRIFKICIVFTSAKVIGI